MVFKLPARLLLRLDHKTALPRLNLYLHWLRILEWTASVSFLGIFLHFALSLPHGFDISNKMTAVYAMSIAAAVYPLMIWILWLVFRSKKRKVLYLRVSRATDSLIVAPLLIALAVILGTAGLPANCNELSIFDRGTYLATLKRSTNTTVVAANATTSCAANATANDCGTGRQQVADMGKVCRMAKAGFSLVIVATIAVYLMIAIVNLYLYHKPRDDGPGGLGGHRRGPSLANGASESTSRLTDMSQIGAPHAAHIANSDTAPGEPPPPYTSRPSNNERIASAEEVRRTAMMTNIAQQMTMTSLDARDGTDRLSTATDEHPAFAPLRRTDSVINTDGSPTGSPNQRTVVQANPTVVEQASNAALASRSASLRGAGHVVPSTLVDPAASIRTLEDISTLEGPNFSSITPTSVIRESSLPARVEAARILVSGKRSASQEIVSTTKDESTTGQPPAHGRGSWGYSITVMLDDVGGPTGVINAPSGSNIRGWQA